MIHQHTLQTAAAFERISDALLGKTDDDLNQLMLDLEDLLYRAKVIHDTAASFSDAGDYNPLAYCDIPKRF